jgi:hypothetical protein
MRHILLAASIACLALHSKAQNKKTPVREPSKPSPDSVYSSLKWRNVGPFRGGRTNAVCGVPGNDLLYYAGPRVKPKPRFTILGIGPVAMETMVGEDGLYFFLEVRAGQWREKQEKQTHHG